ncbi:XrtA/PEP-CTERM system TPR-repeat protein PrsT [Azoarcus sp. L1K30]|uniref:XrtA/PEP-CTERM system TPR-repeat protein PrsT n=1 Tax=Azoarcus sp. L1K30 TaxID=2820277 RepID=UPI002013BADF|nr:XrtA/PEP-CTERM system TPR-repeat protein PrsT [Azoarcus sp. L1K30]
MSTKRIKLKSSRWGRSARHVFVAVISAATLAGCSDSPEEMVASAKAYLAKNDVNAASIQLKNALQENGKLAEGRFLLGKINLQQGDMRGAAKELERAAELGYDAEAVAPLLARALLGSAQADRVIKDFAAMTMRDKVAQAQLLTTVGEAYLVKAMAPEARQRFEAALSLSPEDNLARVGLGRAKLVAGDPAGAQAEAETVIARKADLAEAQVLLSDAMLAQGKPDAAIVALEAAVKAKPNSVTHHFALASLLLRQNSLEAATRQLAEMKRIAPNHPSTLYVQAFLDFRNGRLTEARDGMALVVKNAPDFLPGRLLAGSVLFRLNDHLQARQHLLKVLEGAPRQETARRLLAASYLATGEPVRALESVQPLFDRADQDPGLAGLIGQIYLAKGDFDKAQTYLAKSAKGAPEDVAARTRLGIARLAGGDAERAFADLEAASALDEKAGEADLALILAYMQRNEFDRALAAYATLEHKQPDNPQTYNLKGGILLAKRDLAGARAAFEKSLQVRPDFLAAVVNLARLDLADNKPELARGRFERILQDNPKNVDALLAFADLQVTTGDPQAAVLDTLERAAQAGPGMLPPQLALIQQHLRMRDSAKALTIAQQAAAAQPGDPRALEALARAQLATGEARQTIATLLKLVNVQPQSPAPLVMLADVQRQVKEDAAAEQTLLKALALKPDSADVLQRLVGVQVTRGDKSAALATAKQAQRQFPAMALGYALEGDVLGSGGQWADAVAAYKKALDRSKSGEYVNKLHSALLRVDRKQEADKLVSDWLRAEPKDLLVRGYLAERALAEKRYGEAVQLFRSMNEIAPRNALILNNLAWSAAAVKDAQALNYAEQALALAPDNPVVLDTVGVIQIDNGQPGKGMANLERAVTLAPELPQLQMNLARSYAKLDRKAEARRVLEALMPKLSAGTPAHAEASELLKTL